MKIANLVFSEHEMLLKTDSIQKQQIASLNEAVSYSLQLDTIYNNKEANYLKQIKSLEKKNKRKATWNKILGGGFGISLFAFLASMLW